MPEVQKLAWFLESATNKLAAENPFKLHFSANRNGPYADDMRHLRNSPDGCYRGSGHSRTITQRTGPEQFGLGCDQT